MRRLSFCRWRLMSLASLMLAVVANGGWFQAPEPTQNQVPAPTIRVSTHLVLVDVVVSDKQGKPIAGLHPEDFELQENGKAQKISGKGSHELKPGDRIRIETPGGGGWGE